MSQHHRSAEAHPRQRAGAGSVPHLAHRHPVGRALLDPAVDEVHEREDEHSDSRHKDHVFVPECHERAPQDPTAGEGVGDVSFRNCSRNLSTSRASAWLLRIRAYRYGKIPPRPRRMPRTGRSSPKAGAPQAAPRLQ